MANYNAILSCPGLGDLEVKIASMNFSLQMTGTKVHIRSGSTIHPRSSLHQNFRMMLLTRSQAEANRIFRYVRRSQLKAQNDQRPGYVSIQWPRRNINWEGVITTVQVVHDASQPYPVVPLNFLLLTDLFYTRKLADTSRRATIKDMLDAESMENARDILPNTNPISERMRESIPGVGGSAGGALDRAQDIIEDIVERVR